MLFKRLFDITASFFGLLFLIPVFLLIAILIKKRMSGPVIFSQKRVGLHGRLFTIYKFRTMTVNHNGSTISILGEKRITPFGAFLRRYKLDELPELWNVLKGDMSFVGPRPDMPGYADRLSGDERLILKLRPGITGPATLIYAKEEEILSLVGDPQKYNDEILWPEKVRLNLEYYETRSFIKDLRFIFMTLFRVKSEQKTN